MDPKKAVWKESERHYRDLFWREERGELTEEESARLNDITKRLGMSKLDFLWGMWHIAYNTLQHKDREAGLGKDPNADTGPKEPVDQDSNPDGTAGQAMSPEISDLPVLENMKEDAALLAHWEHIMRSDVEVMGLLQDRDSHYAKHEDCALKETRFRRNLAVDNLVSRAWSGGLTFGEIKKLQSAAAGDGQQLSPDERQTFVKHAEDRGQTLEEFLQILVEINRFVGKTGEDDFNYEDNHEGMIDHCARIPLFLPAAFSNIDVMRTPDRRKMLAAIIVLQADEMKEQAKGRGTWPLKTTVSVAKALIINYSSLLRNGAAVGADEPPHGGPTVYGLAYLSMFKDAHEAASGLLKNALCASYVEKAKVDAICGWLRDTKVSFPPQLPWGAPKNVHEGLELLLDRFGLSGQPQARMPAELSVAAAKPPEPLTGNEEPGRVPESPEEPAVPKTPDVVGKLVILEWNERLKYDGEEFTIHGKERWHDIRELMAAKGEFVKLEKGFPQRFAKNDAQRFRKLATEPEGPGRNGTGRYRIKP